MTCQELVGVIDPYLDDELSVVETLRVQGHVLFCDSCRKVVESETLLHSLITADTARDQAPAELRERILQRAWAVPSGIRGSRRRPRWFPISRVVLAGTAILGLLLGVLLIPGVRGPRDLEPLAAEVAGKHLLYSQGAETALEMRTAEAPRLAAWLEHRVGFSVKLPLLARPGERLVGGRVSSMADTPAAYLLYERDGRRISLFIAQPPRRLRLGGTRRVIAGVELYTTAVRGVALVWWEDAERLYAAASTGGVEDLTEFALLCVRSERFSNAGDRRPGGES